MNARAQLARGRFFCSEKGDVVMKQAVYSDENDIAKVVEKFERCEFGIEEFTHARHLTVAAWYLCHLSPEEAQVRMKTGLVRFIEHHGKQGYHETITRFWMEIAGKFVERMPREAGIMEKVNNILECFDNKDVLFEYYSRERVLSEFARREWVGPDLKAIACQQRRRPVVAGQGQTSPGKEC
jgi:hypothetical protein